MPEIEGGKIIDTIKGKKGKRSIHYPVDPDGKPLVPKNPNEIYDRTAKKKQMPFEGEVVDTEA
ncbi:hypothetical protein KKE03_02225 [Patescibacteria group bacterium]|nr:hypothetical protein [Patescibacteria group bacterium]